MRRFVLAVMVVFGMVCMSEASEVRTTSAAYDFSKMDACSKAKSNAAQEAKNSRMKVVGFGECTCEKAEVGGGWKCAVDYRVVPNN